MYKEGERTPLKVWFSGILLVLALTIHATSSSAFLQKADAATSQHSDLATATSPTVTEKIWCGLVLSIYPGIACGSIPAVEYVVGYPKQKPTLVAAFLCRLYLIFNSDDPCAGQPVVPVVPRPTSSPPRDISPGEKEVQIATSTKPTTDTEEEPSQSDRTASPPPVVAGATYVTNEYKTYPTTYVYETIEKTVREGGGSSNGVSEDRFEAQVRGTIYSIEEGDSGIRDDIATEVKTASLTVTGNSTLGALTAATSTIAALTVSGDSTLSGNATISGTLTAGSLSVAGVSSGGAVTAPYFTATSTTTDSNFHNALYVDASTGRVGVGTASPTRPFQVYGSGTQFRIGIDDNDQFEIARQTGRVQFSLSNTSDSVLILEETSGDVSIGGDVGPDAKLEVSAGGGGSDLFMLSSDDNTDGDLFIVDASGNVGIGTTDPNSALEVRGSNKQLILGESGDTTSLEIGGGSNYAQFEVTNNATQAFQWLDDGVQRFLIDANGDITIGADTSPDFKLDLAGTGDLGYFGITSGAADGDVFIVDNSGNVGIGTTTPTAKLEVLSTNTAANVLSLRSALGQSASPLAIFSNAGATQFEVTANGWVLAGYGGSSETNPSYGFTGDSDTGMYHPTSNQLGISTGGTERLRIDNSGNVGIGTTDPDGLLHVSGNGANFTASSNANEFILEQTGGQVGMSLLTDDVRDSSIYFGSPSDSAGAEIVWNLSNDLFKIGTVNSGADLAFETGNGTEAVRILDSGNVGIGTTNPGSKLEIAGASSFLRIRNTSFSANQVNGISFYHGDGTTNNTEVAIIRSKLNSGGTSGELQFFTENASVLTQQMVINNLGHVTPGTDNTQTLGASGLDWECIYYEGGNLGTCASDERLKTDIQDYNFGTASSSALSQVADLEVKAFAFKSAPNDIYHGLIAQDVLDAAPALVTENNQGFLAVRYADIPWLLLEALQDLYAMVSNFAVSFVSADITATNQFCLADDGGTTCFNRADLNAMLDTANHDGGTPESDDQSHSLPNPSDDDTATTTTAAGGNAISTPAAISESPTDTTASSTPANNDTATTTDLVQSDSPDEPPPAEAGSSGESEPAVNNQTNPAETVSENEDREETTEPSTENTESESDSDTPPTESDAVTES